MESFVARYRVSVWEDENHEDRGNGWKTDVLNDTIIHLKNGQMINLRLYILPQ